MIADLPVSSFTYINFCFIHFETVLCASVLHQSVMSDTLRPQRTAACQAPLSMELSRQEYWSGLPFSLPGDLPNPEIKAGSPALQAYSKKSIWDLPGDPVVKIPHFHCRSQMFNPWIRKIHWRRKWQPTPVFLLEKCYGQRSLVGYSPCGHKKLDTT